MGKARRARLREDGWDGGTLLLFLALSPPPLPIKPTMRIALALTAVTLCTLLPPLPDAECRFS